MHNFETSTSSETESKSDGPQKLLFDGHFEREVAETFLRCVKMNFDQVKSFVFFVTEIFFLPTLPYFPLKLRTGQREA